MAETQIMEMEVTQNSEASGPRALMLDFMVHSRGGPIITAVEELLAEPGFEFTSYLPGKGDQDHVWSWS